MAQLNSLHVFIITSCILAHTAVTTYAYPQYRDEIPNGLRSVEVDTLLGLLALLGVLIQVMTGMAKLEQ